MEVKIPDKKYLKALVIIASVFLAGFTIYILMELQGILVPFVLAVFITLLFQPFYRWMLTKKVPSFLAIIIIVLTILVLSNITSVFVFAGINSFKANFPVYEQKFYDLYQSFTATFNITQKDMADFQNSLKIENLLKEGTFTSTATNVFSSVLGIFSNFVLILIYVIFLYSEIGSLKNRVARAFTQERGHKIVKTLIDIFEEVRRYIIGKTILSLGQAIAVAIVLGVTGVEFYFIWAFLFFVTDYIPYIGSLVVSALIGVAMLIQFDNFITPVIIMIILIVIQNIKGNMIEPKVLGEKLDLSPILLLLSLLFWGYIWGVVGMILAYPIMSTIKIILMNFEQTRPIAIMMSYNLNSKSFKRIEEEAEKVEGVSLKPAGSSKEASKE